MKTFRSIPLTSLVVVITISVLSGFEVVRQTVSYEATSASKFSVEGTSTIHDWTCEAPDVQGTVQLGWETGEIPVIENAQIRVAVGSMDCHHGKMDDKLRKALKLEEHPTMLFELNKAEVIATASADSFEVATDGFMMIAGQTRRVQITQYVSIRNDGTVVFRGDLPLAMKDYNVKPPTAVFGTIRTGNEVVIHFELVVERSTEAT